MVTVNRMTRYTRDWVLLRKLVEQLVDGARHAGTPGAVRFLEAVYEEVCQREQAARQREET
jgi:hypothetical protein